ncbi:MAG: DNA polymerase III subunit delta [bacterium]
MGKFFIIYGDEPFFIEQEVQAVKSAYSSEQVEVMESQVPLSHLYQNVASDSLFGARKLIVINNPWFLLKKTEEKQLTMLWETLETLKTVDHALLLYCNGNIDQRLKQVKTICKYADVKICKGFKAWEQGKLLAWIKQQLQKAGKQVTQEALLALEHTGGVHLQHVAKECEKLCIYVGEKAKIELADVQAACSGSAATVFKFNEAFQQANYQQSMELVHSLLEQGEDPVRLIGLMASNFRFYLHALSLINEKKSTAEIAKELQKNSYYLQKVLPAIKKGFTIETLKQSIIHLATLDFQIKSGQIAAKRAVYLAISGLSGPS